MPMNGSRRAYLLSKRADVLERLQYYKDAEHDILFGADRCNTVGSHRLERYDLNIKDIKQIIDDLQKELSAIDSELSGGSGRRAFAIVLRDC